LSVSRTHVGYFKSWVGLGLGGVPLNGMSHGAAGFACALFALADASDRQDFRNAGRECINYENYNYNPNENNWADMRSIEGDVKRVWQCQWCHGAPGIGLSRIAIAKNNREYANYGEDINAAIRCAVSNWPNTLDTLCCGTLGSLEFVGEAGRFTGNADLIGLYEKRLMEVLHEKLTNKQFRWNTGDVEFNLGLYRGLSGVGYTLLRRIDSSLPNLLIFE
jgi:lantibiotic modifying enzyme